MSEEPQVAEGQVPESAPEASGQVTPESNANAEPQTQSTWYDNAEGELKGYIQNKGWDDPLKAVKSYQELEKYRGANEDQLIKLPNDPNEDGAMEEVWNKLGRPESPEGYEIDVPDGAEIDSDRLNFYKDVAHKAGVTQEQFKKIAEADTQYWQNYVNQIQEEKAKQQEAEYEALKKEWGSHAEEREELARRGLKSLLPENVNKEELSAKIEEAIGTAATLKLFANAGDKLGREDSIHDSGGDRPFGYTREQAIADRSALMSELKAEPERLQAYNNGVGKDYDKMQRINKILAG